LAVTEICIINDKSFEGEKFRGFAGFIRYVGKSFVISSITTFIIIFMVFQLYKTATSISMKASCSSHEFSLKLSLAYSEMDESRLQTHACADFTLSRMTVPAVTGEELATVEVVQDETDC